MRRLPIFFVLDCSESMAGEPIHQMQKGIDAIVTSLRSDPHALETVHISILAFAGIAKMISPLLDVMSFYPPQLPLGSGTNLSAALNALMSEIDRQVRKSTADQKGDWKPIVYLVTDGKPTDDPTQAIAKWKKAYASKANMIVIGMGPDADLVQLKQLTDHVYHFAPENELDFRKFIQWVSASISVQSKSIGMVNEDKMPVANLDKSVVSLLKDVQSAPFQKSDNSCITLVGRCSKTKRPYLIKYVSMVSKLAGLDMRLNPGHYNLAGCFHLDETYFEWSDQDVLQDLVSTEQLEGAPGCPHCGAATAFAVCSCGKLMCINGPDSVVCPWCNNEITFGRDGSSNFDVQRSRG